MSIVTFDVKIGRDTYPLVRDPAHVHPTNLHRHLGTHTTTLDQEQAIRRLLDAVEAADWFDEMTGEYLGRNEYGIGIAGRD
jgi:hypothetical protein